MAGDLTVQSEIGVGSTFCLTLPLARSDSAG
jgi:signal transduction histidine kinase